ncbi:MAG: hypothetical protein K2X74_14250 [Acetobacteraceae bacterium]|nr:hypothetical protein [Acetobacteraceae bacterium]
MSGSLISVVDNGAGGTGGTGDDTIQVLADLTIGATIDGNGGTDLLIVSPGITENDLGALTVIQEMEEIATGSAPARLTTTQLAAFDRIVDWGFMDPVFNLSAGNATATLQVVGLDSLTVNGSGDGEGLDFGNSFDNTVMILSGKGGNDTLTSGDGDDSLLGGNGADVLTGLGGLDWVEGGGGNDRILMSLDDTVYGDSSTTNVSGADTIAIMGTLSSGEIWGGGGIDVLEFDGTPGVNQSLGAGLLIAEVEVLKLENGQELTLSASTLAGFDTLTVLGTNGVSDSATLNLTTTIDAFTLEVTLFESLEVNGINLASSDGNDQMTFSTTLTDITVNGQAGNDSVDTGDGDDTLNGGLGNDTLDGNAGLDDLFGEDGNDVLRVRSGDNAEGGIGDDTIGIWEDLLFGNVTLDGGTGHDVIDANGTKTLGNAVTLVDIEELRLDASTFTLRVDQLDSLTTIGSDSGAPDGVLVILGTGFAPVTDVTGLATLTVTGDINGDVLTFTSLATTIILNAGRGNDSIVTGGGGDELTGGNGNDTLNGEGGADRVTGGKGRDLLIGGGGNDTISGNAGNDTLSGGAGLDTFSFTPGGGTDTIIDFVDGDDVIRIRNFGAAFDTDAEVLAVAVQAGADVAITLANPTGGNTVILIENLLLAQLTGADIDVL